MPLYDYQCAKCKEITEVRHGFDDAHTDPCPKCGGNLVRLFNPAGIVFKGSGFYVNDSRKAAQSKSDSGEPASAAPAEKPAASSTATPSTPPAPSSSSKESAA